MPNHTHPCPTCGSKAVTKKGIRAAKRGASQLYLCSKCRRRFAASALPTYTYPPQAILSAPVLYYQGHSLSVTRNRIAARFHIDPSLSTVARWVESFGKRAGIKSLRKELTAFAKPSSIIRRRTFKHEQFYLFQMHAFKLHRCTGDFNGAKKYLADLMDGKTLIRPESFSLRASSIDLGVTVAAQRRFGAYESSIAEIALKAAASNYQRHMLLQRFFLATDKFTVASEIPLFLTPDETQSILSMQGGMLGHADFLQIFERSVVILDYKPDAAREKQVISQLLLYAIAFSRRTGIHLNKIKLAWFDEKDYFWCSAISAYCKFKDSIGVRG